MDGIPFLLPVELTPLKTRAKSVAIATGFFWLCNFFVVMISPVLIARIKYGTYILWAGTNFVFIPLIYFLSKFPPRVATRLFVLPRPFSFTKPHTAVPETMKANLEDIDILFERNPTWIIGPGSRKKLAAIVREREGLNEIQRQHGHDEKEVVKTIEDVE